MDNRLRFYLISLKPEMTFKPKKCATGNYIDIVL
jgi:hypothetical protein